MVNSLKALQILRYYGLMVTTEQLRKDICEANTPVKSLDELMELQSRWERKNKSMKVRSPR